MGHRRDDEMDREIRTHLELEAEDLAAEGMAAQDAMYAARRAFGNVARTQEDVRAVWKWLWFDDALRDVKLGVRTLGRHPGFAAITILTLALGISATTCIFSVVNTLLLRPLPFTNPDRLVRIVEHIPAAESVRGVARRMPAMFEGEFDWWRGNTKTLSHMAVEVPQTRTLSLPQGNVRLAGVRVSPALFTMRGITPLVGRGLYPDEEATAANVVVLAASTWQRYFGASPDIVNRTIVLDATSYTVVGVMPAEFGDGEFWTPYAKEPPRPGAVSVVPVVARLRDGVAIEAAAAEINALGHQLRQMPLKPGAPPRFTLARLQDDIVTNIRPVLNVFMAAVTVVLLIVCANVANMLLTRGASRQQEIAVRQALGASRNRIARLALTESAVIAAAGAGLGIGLAFAGLDVLRALAAVELPPGFSQALGSGFLPRLGEITIDRTVLGFALTTTVITGLLFGIVPAIRLSSAGIGGTSAVRVSGRNIGGHVLAGVQLCLATTLLIGAALLLHSFAKLASVDLGFDPEHVLSFDVVLPDTYDAERKLAAAEEIARRLGALPGVVAAGFTDSPPLSNRTDNPFRAFIPPLRQDRSVEDHEVDQRLVSPDYLRAIGARLRAGRWLDERDARRTPVPVVISDKYADYYFGDGPAVGAVLPTTDGLALVVGVVNDLRLNGVDKEPPLVGFIDPRHPLSTNNEMLARRGLKRGAQANRLFLTGFTGGLAYAVRVTADPLAIVSDVRRVVAEVATSGAVDSIMPMERVIGGTVAQPRFYAVLVSFFASIAAVLAAIGIYGVLAYAVTHRTREIGIRTALGAQRGDVLRLVMRQGLVLVAVGIASGLLAAFGLSRYLSGMLFGLTPVDPLTYAAVAGAFTAVAMAASYVPARHAMRITPLVALRYE